jgi:hypothetical protein
MDPYICTVRTIEEIRYNPCWVADLSDGQRVYEVHNRSSWLELKEWLRENPSVSIIALHLQFRDHWEPIATGFQDYFFCKSMSCWFGAAPQEQYVVGFRVNDTHVLTRRFNVPELIPAEEPRLRGLEEEIIRIGLIRSNKLPYGLKELSDGNF